MKTARTAAALLAGLLVMGAPPALAQASNDASPDATSGGGAIGAPTPQKSPQKGESDKGAPEKSSRGDGAGGQGH